MKQRNALGQPIGAELDVTLPRPDVVPTTLTGRSCTVRPIDVDADAAPLFAAFGADTSGAGWTYLPYGPFDTQGDFRDWMRRTCTRSDPLFFTILDAGGRPVGMASFLRIDPGSGVVEVGHIHMSPGLQRTPAATEAMALMMGHVFDGLGYRRYEWKCDALNAPSRAAAERLGFAFEGVFRQATHYKGRNRDTAWFAILDRDWPAQRARFDSWLAPENFTGSGAQIAPLARQRNA